MPTAGTKGVPAAVLYWEKLGKADASLFTYITESQILQTSDQKQDASAAFHQAKQNNCLSTDTSASILACSATCTITTKRTV